MVRRLTILFVMAGLGSLFMSTGAQAAPITITKWESITCKEDNELPVAPGVPEPGYEATLTPPPEQCTDATPGKFYTQAAGHPDNGITDFRLATYPAFTGVG